MAVWTEAEALTKWCSPAGFVAAPATFDSGTGGYTTDVRGAQDPSVPAAGRANCIATDCMSWRWFGSGGKGYYGRAGPVVATE